MKYAAKYIGKDTDFIDKINKDSMHIEIIKDQPLLTTKPLNKNIELVFFENIDTVQSRKDLVTLFTEGENIIFFLISDTPNALEYLKLGVDDVFSKKTKIADIEKRFLFLKQNYDFLQIRQLKILLFDKTNKQKSIQIRQKEFITEQIQLPIWKRLFDIVFASVALLLLTPFFLLVLILIRLESKGKVYYTSKRVGMGYKVFDFYKFRTMYLDADKKVDAMMSKNQYADPEEEQKSYIQKAINLDDAILFSDDDVIFESEFLEQKKNKQKNAFFKFVKDPRITKVGRILRNTSIDELPQLLNVLKGDMSIVGNRPLPIYEAELLTSDRWIKRFLGPAGLTGLWQVTKRGGGNKMEADERKELDIEYIDNYSFWYDLKIILKTIPAMLQHEDV